MLKGSSDKPFIHPAVVWELRLRKALMISGLVVVAVGFIRLARLHGWI